MTPCKFALSPVFKTAAAGIMVLVLSATAQGEDKSSWTVYESFQGSSNADGQVLKWNNDVAHGLYRFVRIGGGVPVYMVRGLSTPTAPGTWQTGLGNVYLDLQLQTEGPVTFASTLTAAAPTGSRERGFSTGKVTLDWSNEVAASVGRFRPYGRLGIANTVSDTAFFVRPFSSYGTVGHFEGGAVVPAARIFTVGASAYDVAPRGTQTIASRVIRSSSSGSGRSSSSSGRPVFDTAALTTGTASVASDYGFSTWVGFPASSVIHFQAGYSRSARYKLNSVFFSVGLNVSTLVQK